MRPIRHYDEKRVRGHLFLCMLAYYVTWHLRPMLLDDPTPAEDPAPMGPCPRSAPVRRRDSRRRADDGTPRFPLPELLKRFGSLTAAPIRIPTPQGTCEVLRLSDPNRVVRRAFELLECQPHPPPPPMVLTPQTVARS